jgi:hypothetical protein
MWTEADRRLLRSMRIECDAPPPPLPPLPRFRAVPTGLTGWYRVVDGVRPMLDFGPENFRDPRAAAEDSARQLNERHAVSNAPQRREDEDGA